MKRKIAVCSVEAAAISLFLHLLLISFAGSMVILNVALGRAATLKGENVKRPELERRAVQLPVKIQELQKAGPRPKLSSRMVSAAPAPFALPSMNLPETSFKLADKGEMDQSLSSRSMPGSLDIGVTGVNFFGTRSKGEKIIFILDASREMMEDAKGGYTTYKFAKDKIHQLVDAMPSATLFNVMVCNDSNVDMFRPQPVPATQANRDALKAWLAPVNSDPYNVGQVVSRYRPAVSYGSDIGDGARHWLKAAQAAMEQTADSVFVLCAGFGRYSDRSASSGFGGERDESKMAEYSEKLKAVNARAQKALDAENAARAAKGLPPKIVYNWNGYITDELRLSLPTPPTAVGVNSTRTPRDPEDLVLQHLDAVWMYHYTPKELAAPRLNFVYLVAQDAGTDRNYLDIMALKNTAQAFRGDFKLLRGAKTVENLLRYNPGLE
jgi:hypothetical protein